MSDVEHTPDEARRCGCECHYGYDTLDDSPLVTDAIAAVTACQRCLNDHVPALIEGMRQRAKKADWPKEWGDKPPGDGELG